MTARVYSYTRFSDPSQASGASSDRQADYALKWAQKNGLVLDDALSMRDEGLSAYHQRHVKQGALGVFLRAVVARAIEPGSVLIVESFDRLSRATPLEAIAQFTAIVNAGITIVTAEDGQIWNTGTLAANQSSLFLTLAKMVRANEESATKSRRVRDALRRQCQAWISGKSRALVRFGNTPGWLRVVDGKWEVIPERAQAIALVFDQYIRGAGLGQIAHQLAEAGLATSDAEPNSGHLMRLLRQPALIGEKHIELDGEHFTLEGYYPPMLDRKTFEHVGELVESRSRKDKGIKGAVPSMLTGTGVTVCGYCGSAMTGQTMMNKAREDGTLADYYRRLQCGRRNIGGGCSVPGSCSVAPIERALMRYCSDMVNIERLYAGDRSALPRQEVAAARARLAKIDKNIERLTEALMDSDTPVPMFTKKARELEAERTEVQSQIEKAEISLASMARADLTGADKRWRKLIKGVDRLDYEARTQARMLVADTFERITVYHHGVQPDETPKGVMDVVLLAKGGVERLLRIDAAGEWIASEDADLSPAEDITPRKRARAT